MATKMKSTKKLTMKMKVKPSLLKPDAKKLLMKGKTTMSDNGKHKSFGMMGGHTKAMGMGKKQASTHMAMHKHTGKTQTMASVQKSLKKTMGYA